MSQKRHDDKFKGIELFRTSGFIVMVSVLYLVGLRMQTVELTANYVHMLLGKETTT